MTAMREFFSRCALRAGSLSGRDRLLLVVGTSVLAAGVGYVLVLRTPLVRLQALAREDPSVSVASIQAEVTRLDHAIAATEASVFEAEERLFGGLADLPAEKTESYIIERLDAISGRYAVELMGVDPGESRSVVSFEEHTYEVEANGSFFAVFEWLQELEVELRPLVVNEFGLSPDRTSGGVQLSVRLASYRPAEEAS